jgi:DNA polymerase (family X)
MVSVYINKFKYNNLENRQIIKLLKLAASLMELHDENPFKIRSYTNAIYGLERVEEPLASLSTSELENLDGVGKSTAAKIAEMLDTGTFAELKRLLEITPEGVIKMMDIKGVGPKKIRTLWKELGVESPDALVAACDAGQVAALRGFGEKTQASIKEALQLAATYEGKLLYAQAEPLAIALQQALKKAGLPGQISATGDLRRKMEIVEKMQFVIGSDKLADVMALLNDLPLLEKNEKVSGPFAWRGTLVETGIEIEFLVYPENKFWSQVFINTGTLAHLQARAVARECSLLQIARSETFTSEEAIYQQAGLAYVEPELREGTFELEAAREGKLPALLEMADLRGTLHNHSTYSDGRNTLREMALHCKSLGYEYLGISDHSQTAYYAGGLKAEDIRRQHEEIDQLNKELAPFKIFKGIESDILQDGSLDYSDEILASFDFIVASVHGNLKMEESVATRRLLKAIENPFTTFLGHPTGRLLLKREGYPIDHKAVIDACAKHGVIIEINANPLRLDMDWRWVHYALEQGVTLSINPDAHVTSGYKDMYWGVCVGRKGGLGKEQTFNALSLQEVEKYFESRRQKR